MVIHCIARCPCFQVNPVSSQPFSWSNKFPGQTWSLVKPGQTSSKPVLASQRPHTSHTLNAALPPVPALHPSCLVSSDNACHAATETVMYRHVMYRHAPRYTVLPCCTAMYRHAPGTIMYCCVLASPTCSCPPGSTAWHYKPSSLYLYCQARRHAVAPGGTSRQSAVLLTTVSTHRPTSRQEQGIV